ncbi:flagellin [Selenomonas sp. TAMA-11512]|uniref:flagellin n=1 Tax=Selenomonas sp. TAMA-11512 TaxID=3095337 RepID=UPI00308E953C|nr:flagellin [Selenomonas sp. TAMA-11512]
MPMVVKNNMMAQNTLNTLNKNSKSQQKNMEKASSGMKINGAVDDASGYAISERMRVQIRSLDQDFQNTQNGNSMLKVAEGAIASTVDILKSMKEKAINAANDTNTDVDRAIIQKEWDQMIDQIDDNANITFNGMTLVDGSKNNSVVNLDTTGQYKPGGNYSAFVNTQLGDETTGLTRLTDLTSKTGGSLGIVPSDRLVVSYSVNGSTFSSTRTVANLRVRNLLELPNPNAFASFVNDKDPDYSYIGKDRRGEDVYTPDGQNALTFASVRPGVQGQIQGLTIAIEDRNGNPKKSVNNVLNAFEEMIRGEDASDDNAMNFQIGTKANQAIKVGFQDMTAFGLGLRGKDDVSGAGSTYELPPGAGIKITTRELANAAINVVDAALKRALDMQTTLGAAQMRMNFTATNITTSSENVQAAESTIRDADMAAVMTAYTKDNVLTQAAQSMLSQANQTSSGVLSLLQ